jgi:hypothetical protein
LKIDPFETSKLFIEITKKRATIDVALFLFLIS